MSERWINTVVEVTKATDLTLDSSPEERERVLCDEINDLLGDNQDRVSSAHLELVDDDGTVEIIPISLARAEG